MNDNLDYLCAKYGQEIPRDVTITDKLTMKDVENLIRNSLGVLQEDGLFAFVIFLQSKEKKKEDPIVKAIFSRCDKLLKDAEISGNKNKDIREKFLEITKDIDIMFLVKSIIERCLIYSLYQARALTK
ncbi:MAG: hypothetical protein ACTSRI_14990 [Promethearchaeota archaeon]